MSLVEKKKQSSTNLVQDEPALTEQEASFDDNQQQDDSNQVESKCDKESPLNEASFEEETPDETPVTSDKQNIDTDK